MIAPAELTQNYERLNTPYDPNQPIKNLFQQIHDAWAFAVADGQLYGFNKFMMLGHLRWPMDNCMEM
jgi:hypothetical protein